MKTCLIKWKKSKKYDWWNMCICISICICTFHSFSHAIPLQIAKADAHEEEEENEEEDEDDDDEDSETKSESESTDGKNNKDSGDGNEYATSAVGGAEHGHTTASTHVITSAYKESKYSPTSIPVVVVSTPAYQTPSTTAVLVYVAEEKIWPLPYWLRPRNY